MAASGADLPRLRMRKLLLRRFLRLAASPARLTPSRGWAEVPGEGRPGRARADLGSAWPTLERRLSHEPRARSAPPPPGWAVNEALPATWGASSAWSWTPEPSERSAGRRSTRAPPPPTSATGKDRWAVAFPTGPSWAAGPPAGSRSTSREQRHGGSVPPLARPPGDGGSPCPAAAAWHSEELDRLVLASAGRHLPASPALFCEPGSLRCPSEVFSRSGAKPVPLLNGGEAGCKASPFQDWGRVVLVGEALSRPRSSSSCSGLAGLCGSLRSGLWALRKVGAASFPLPPPPHSSG